MIFTCNRCAFAHRYLPTFLRHQRKAHHRGPL